MNEPAFAPHRPLLPGAAEYVQRPGGNGGGLPEAVRAGWSRIAVFGPHGVGISTELGALEHALGRDYSVFRFTIGRSFDLKRIAPRAVLQHILERLPRARPPSSSAAKGSPDSVLRDEMRRRLKCVGHAALLVDDLDKCEAGLASELMGELFALSEEAAVVVAIPLTLAYGPAAAILGEQGARAFPLRPCVVGGFLEQIAARRLGRSRFQAEVVARGAAASGGLPRVFLQLLGGALGRAAIARRPTADPLDLDVAEAEHGASRLRMLMPGDVEALNAAEGTDGREIELSRKLRFLAHGQLLEYDRGDRIVMQMAPTLARALRSPQENG